MILSLFLRDLVLLCEHTLKFYLYFLFWLCVFASLG